MGFDNQLFSFVRDGEHEGMAITILGSGRSLQLQQINRKPIQIHETSQETERCNTKIDREAATRDRDRERANRRYSRDFDVRYNVNWTSLKEKLLSAYSCNQHQCPMIRERLIRHNMSNHGGRRCEKKCTLATSKSKNYVSIRAGPNFDQYSDEKGFDCPMPHTSSNYSKHSNNNRTGKYHNDRSKPIKGKLKNDKKYVDGCTSPFDNTLKIKNDSTPKSCLDEYADTPYYKNSKDYCDSQGMVKYCENVKNPREAIADNNYEQHADVNSCNNNLANSNRNDNANGCIGIVIPEYSGNNNANIYMRSGRHLDDCRPNVDANGCCDISQRSGYTDTCTENTTNYRNACTNYDDTKVYDSGTRYVEGGTPSNSNLIKYKNYASGFCDPLNNPDCTDNFTTTYNSSYIGNIEAPKFPIARSGNKCDEDNYQPSTSKTCNDTSFMIKAEKPTDTPVMVDNRKACALELNKLKPFKKLFNIVESTGCDSVVSSIMSIVTNRKNSKSKLPETSKYKPNRSSFGSSTSFSYKPIRPYAVDKLSNSKSDSKLSLTINETKYRKNSNLIYREVKEWIREVPMYLGIEKEAKDKNTTLIDDLVIKLYKLSGEAKSAGYDEIVRNEIDICLNKIPLWYPGAKQEQNEFKRSLVDRLTQRLKNLDRKNGGRDNSKRKSSRNAVNEVHTSLTSCSHSYSNQLFNDPKYVAINFEIYSKIRQCFEDARVDCNNKVIEKAAVILYHCDELADPKGKRQARNEIINLLVTYTNLSEDQAWNLAKVIIKKVRKVFDEEEACTSSQTCSQLREPFTTSVYTAIEEASPLTYLVTSTPKKKQVKKEIPKLNPQETQYMKNVANLIRTWMNTLPKTFNAPDEQEFRETMINDLAGDIMDEAKLQQLAPDSKKDEREIQKYIVCRWIYKLGAFEFRDVDDKIETFLNTLQEIPIPTMTQPHRGNRQAMENIKFYEGSKWIDNFVPTGTDVLKDEISIWMHEQPSNMFARNDQTFRHNKINELAQILENKLGKQRSKKEVSQDISKWLNQIVRPEKKREISNLTEHLRDRVIKLPKDATLAGIVENRSKMREEHRRSKLEYANSPKLYNADNESADQNNTMAMFISKFIEHHYDIDDPLARRAFNRLLNGHLLSLSPPTRKEVYDNFEKNEYDNRFPQQKVISELEYIKDISDWLKNLPLDASYNTLGNQERIDFVNSLALSIREIEEDRKKNPDEMDFDFYMNTVILEHLKLLPIPKEYYDSAPFMIDQLFSKIVTRRQAISDTIKQNESINTTGINSNNIGDFIEEFIKINGDDLALDEVKMEAWAIRLIREIKKIIPDTSRPSILSKAHVYNKLTEVPIPSDETAKIFNLELDYVKEITNWMKNLPLLSMNCSEKENVTQKICLLAENMVDTSSRKDSNPDNKDIDTDFKEYVAKWISELPLDKKQEIVLPVIIQQLMNRMKKIKQKDNLVKSSISGTNTNKSAKVNKSKSSIFNFSKKNIELNPSNLTDAIEKWSRSLPIKAENYDATTNMKNDVSRKLFQEIGQLNMNPTVNNDDIIYKDKLGDEINSIFENLPQSDEFQHKKNKLKEDIVSTIVEIKNEIKETTAGNTYKLELEKKIDTSIPNPVPCYQIYDPGFEIYKDRLATAFILENFDHGTDVVKTKYETLLRKEIDKYFDHARNRNAIPLSKDQINNELYSALFKVSIPNEASVINEVEKVKTRCEIDAWFEELPMREANDLNELLDWDKILSSLSIRIHQIEISESKPDDKIFKEIMKWLVKLPIEPGNENKLEEFSKNLLKRLKSTADHRKCVTDSSKTKSKKVKSKSKTKVSTKKSKECSQANPSSSDKMLTTLQPTSASTKRRSPRKNSADEIYDIVHTWCNQLPININDPKDAQVLKDNITTKMIVKISEINTNNEIFHNDDLYDILLGKKLEELVSMIPTTSEFNNSKAAKIHELKENVKSVKPHIREERAGHKYKQDLINIVDKILDKPSTLSPEKEAYLHTVKNDIVDSFVQYKYNNHNDEGKQGHKINLQDNILKYNTFNIKNNTTKNKQGMKINPLMKTNQLISELAKIPPKSYSIISDKVEEIRLKKEVADFFNEIGVKTNDIAKVTYLKESLAKKLHDIEINNGYNLENENKMKQEIMKCLKKLGKDKNLAVIDAFITNLKDSVIARQMPHVVAEEYSTEFNKHDCNHACPKRNRSSRNGSTRPFTPYTNNDIPAKFPKRAVCPSIDDRVHENKTVSFRKEKFCERNCDKTSARTEFISNEELEMPSRSRETERLPGEEINSSDDEDMGICLCKKIFGSHKRRRYCMVPVPMPYICEGRNVLNSLWCGMPLSIF